MTGIANMLHISESKSKRVVPAPREEIELVRSRLRLAQEHNDDSRRPKDRHD